MIISSELYDGDKQMLRRMEHEEFAQVLEKALSRDMEVDEFREFIVEIERRSGILTRKRMAEIANAAESTISAIEAGRQMPVGDLLIDFINGVSGGDEQVRRWLWKLFEKSPAYKKNRAKRERHSENMRGNTIHTEEGK